MKVNNAVIVDFIASCLEIGEKRDKILSKVVKKWQLNTRTFDRRLKEAKEQESERISKLKSVKNSIDIKNVIAAREYEILSVNERKIILSKIGSGELSLLKPFVVAGKIKKQKVVPDWNDRKSAIAELNKMEGDYAPDKVANVTTDGKDVKPTQQLSNSQFAKLIKSINETGTGKG